MSLLTFDDRVWPNRRIHPPPDGGTGRRGPLDPVGFLLAPHRCSRPTGYETGVSLG
jgi:hypothetical protein